MTPTQKSLVVGSFARAYAAKRNVGRRFYLELFARAPELRPLFPQDLATQQELLNQTLATVVKEVHRLEVLSPALTALARRHAGYGAEPAHFALVGEALIGALAEETPGGLSYEEEAAWGAAYGAISGLMIPALEEELARAEGGAYLACGAESE
ncbi:putative nitric oxide dioxygenase [Roseivivax marinus]|uniref:Putative nitric oxide dioxygenase n=1 Tax=Roseivivax marinus TaxID=1379903 RepID=W4HNQ7_9RHOB|nr:globin domain-containing protein [Roseivivax marinus]ETW14053.1 putative nitric oxide dioxygenase [Roseivivax marinus]